jgi:hypothetical protein
MAVAALVDYLKAVLSPQVVAGAVALDGTRQDHSEDGVESGEDRHVRAADRWSGLSLPFGRSPPFFET